jgi:hypothetical protein
MRDALGEPEEPEETDEAHPDTAAALVIFDKAPPGPVGVPAYARRAFESVLQQVRIARLGEPNASPALQVALASSMRHFRFCSEFSMADARFPKLWLALACTTNGSRTCCSLRTNSESALRGRSPLGFKQTCLD